MRHGVKRIVGEVIAEKGAWLVEVEVMPGHVHLLVEVDLQFGVHRLVKAVKGTLLPGAVRGVSPHCGLVYRRCGRTRTSLRRSAERCSK